MAYINNVLMIVLVLFLVFVTDMRLAEAEPNPFPKMDADCAAVIPDLLEKCFATVRETPTVECCSDLKSASTKQVTCLCDNYIANPALINITGPYSAGITTACDVSKKYSCDSTSKDGKEGSSSQNTTSTSNGSKTDSNGGARNKIAASMGVFGLVASLFFAMF